METAKMGPQSTAAGTAGESSRSVGSEAEHSIDPHLIERRAYILWEARGCPIGTPEVDWLRAERELSESEYAPYAQAARNAAG